jgi:ATP synthase protein I
MPENDKKFAGEISKKETRKQCAREKANGGLWCELGMFGIIGWSVTIPLLIGVALGLWIDHTWPGRISWTLTFLFIGAVLGCLNAWYWVSRQCRIIEKKDKDE